MSYKPQYKIAMEFLQSKGFILKQDKGRYWSWNISHPQMDNDNFKRFHISYSDIKNIAVKVQINELWDLDLTNNDYFDELFSFGTYNCKLGKKMLFFFGRGKLSFPLKQDQIIAIKACKLLSKEVENIIGIYSFKIYYDVYKEMAFCRVPDENHYDAMNYNYDLKTKELSTTTVFDNKILYPGILTRKIYEEKKSKLRSFE